MDTKPTGDSTAPDNADSGGGDGEKNQKKAKERPATRVSFKKEAKREMDDDIRVLGVIKQVKGDKSPRLKAGGKQEKKPQPTALGVMATVVLYTSPSISMSNTEMRTAIRERFQNLDKNFTRSLINANRKIGIFDEIENYDETNDRGWRAYTGQLAAMRKLVDEFVREKPDEAKMYGIQESSFYLRSKIKGLRRSRAASIAPQKAASVKQIRGKGVASRRSTVTVKKEVVEKKCGRTVQGPLKRNSETAATSVVPKKRPRSTAVTVKTSTSIASAVQVVSTRPRRSTGSYAAHRFTPACSRSTRVSTRSTRSARNPRGGQKGKGGALQATVKVEQMESDEDELSIEIGIDRNAEPSDEEEEEYVMAKEEEGLDKVRLKFKNDEMKIAKGEKESVGMRRSPEVEEDEDGSMTMVKEERDVDLRRPLLNFYRDRNENNEPENEDDEDFRALGTINRKMEEEPQQEADHDEEINVTDLTDEEFAMDDFDDSMKLAKEEDDFEAQRNMFLAGNEMLIPREEEASSRPVFNIRDANDNSGPEEADEAPHAAALPYNMAQVAGGPDEPEAAVMPSPTHSVEHIEEPPLEQNIATARPKTEEKASQTMTPEISPQKSYDDKSVGTDPIEEKKRPVERPPVLVARGTNTRRVKDIPLPAGNPPVPPVARNSAASPIPSAAAGVPPVQAPQPPEPVVVEPSPIDDDIYIVEDVRPVVQREAPRQEHRRHRESHGMIIYSSDGKEYSVENQLGKGSFGEVFQVVDRRTDIRYAMKISQPTGMSDVMQLTEEAFYRKILEKPNKYVAAKYPLFTFTHNKVEYRAELMDLYETDLFDLIHNNPVRFSALHCLELIGQVCTALNHLSELGFLHCDIKPDNIMLAHFATYEDKNRKYICHVDARLIDFNVLIDREGKAGPMKFTGQSIPYRAPEMALEMWCDERIDVWSVGIVALQLLTRNGFFVIDDRCVYEWDEKVQDEAILGEIERLFGPVPEKMKMESRFRQFREQATFPSLIPEDKRSRMELEDIYLTLSNGGRASRKLKEILEDMLCVDASKRAFPGYVAREVQSFLRSME